MYRNLPSLNALRAFEAAGRHGSFSDAAEELGVSHSSISRHIRGLEQRLEVQLFRPQSRGVVLTDQGQAYLAQLSPAFDAIAEATESLQPQSQSHIVVNSDPLLAEKWLMPRLGAFRQLHPGIEIRLETSNRLARLDQHEADMALRFFRYAESAGSAPLLFDSPLSPYGVQGFADAARDPNWFLTVQRLVDRDGDPWRDWLQAAGIPAEVVPETERVLRSSPLAIAAALAGQGVILTGPELIPGELSDGRLVRLSDVTIRAGSYNLVLREGARRRRGVRRFTEWLLEEARQFREGVDPSPARHSKPKS